MTVVTRFPPSPTGAFHVGSARTALFNWLYARHFDGCFQLRIEDTDAKRSTKDAVDSILDGMKWLGLDWDGKIVFQSDRRDRHLEVAKTLLENNKAYNCYCTPDELSEMRSRARSEGRPNFYDRRWRERGATDAAINTPSVIRIKMPLEGKTTIEDIVQGKVTIDNEQLDDFILVRADGTPTYMLSVVVDDYDAGITHIIRGDDHLNNAFRQYHLCLAADWTPPEYAHIPLIHGADGKKLSKRHGATSVQEFRELGIIPEALRNYLLRLGWSYGDAELISTAQAIKWFTLENVGRSSAQFDWKKLENLNSHYLRTIDSKLVVNEIVERFKQNLDCNIDETEQKRIRIALPLLLQRSKNIIELSEAAKFLVIPPSFPLSDKKAATVLNSNEKTLKSIASKLESLLDWSAANLETELRQHAEQIQLGFGKLAQPLRAALSGSLSSPGIFEVLEILGRKESLIRVNTAVKNIET